MSSRGEFGSFEDVKMEGTNVGATMIARRTCSGDSRDSCCINIYISNNVQGVNNSILVGSSVRLRDPGVSFSIDGLTFRTESLQRKNRLSDTAVAFSVVLLSAALIISLFLSLFL
ncbi:PREDICTED: uncharacterized protein LOC109173488 [Ipomoea nil]|uniref:uncharacterized protein LOC109173488 n=1 Tax=Ipomoea nil TaxID=35883 RepID=UPI0009008FD4|nr:PREDICTED: uncharacterized protein LOC109173488 [Ipomoea nil]